MNNLHRQTLEAFRRRLNLLLMFRAAVRWTAFWLFVWGVAVLAARVAGIATPFWFLAGLCGVIPAAAAAAFREWKRRPSLTEVRAVYDRVNRCGGVIMAEEAGAVAAWMPMLPPAVLPALRWRSGPSLAVLGAAALFVSVSMILPDRWAGVAARPLEIGPIVEELQAQIQLLEEESILEEKKAADLKEQLARMERDASGLDPHRTWEALDHIRESNAEAARKAAEEALSQLGSLTQSQALAGALQMAMESGLDAAVALRAAQDLQALMKMAQLEEALMNGDFPPDLLADAAALANHENLAALLQAIEFNKDKLGQSVARMADLKLIDAELLGKCEKAGLCPDLEGLAAFLCENGSDCESFSALAMAFCRGGGITRGPGPAPMTWGDASSDEGLAFRDEALPPSEILAGAQLIGVSRAAPEVSGDTAAAAHGALAGASAGGGTAHAQSVLPRHRRAVQRFFERDEPGL